MAAAAGDARSGLMFLPFQLCAVVVCILLPALVLLLRRGSSSKLLPPGPAGLPIVGHLHLLGKRPHYSLYNLSKTHGPLMFLRLGAVPLIVASTPDMARQILQTNDQTFSMRPQNFAIPAQLFGYSDILFAPPGPYWKLMREICVTDLFSNKRLEYFRPVRTEEVRGLMLSILQKGGATVGRTTPVNVRELLLTASSNIISRITLGKRMLELSSSSQADPSMNIVALIVEVTHLLGVFNVGDYIPSLAWMDLQGYVRRSKAVARKASAVFQEVIDGRRRRAGSDESAQDFLDLLLRAALNAKGKSIQISDETIRAVLIEIFAAGIDTASVTIEWAFASLLDNPTKMKTMQEELGRVVGTSRLVQEEDLPQLPYLRAVVKESMRLHPVGPLLMPHMSSQPCKIYDYEIPGGTLAFVNVWAIGRDPKTWENPLEFSPERFLDSNVDVRGQHFELLPFGTGRRGCPGWRLGLLNVHIILASLLHGFDWTIEDKLDMTEMSGIVLTLANPVVAIARPKLATHLFEAHV